MNRMKHCGTCRFWALEETPDTGVCTCEANNHSFGPPVGGVSSYSNIYTHAIFGCVNHKEEINHE